MTHHLRVYVYDDTLELGRIRISAPSSMDRLGLEKLIEADVPSIRTARGHLKRIFPCCIVVAKVTKE